MKDVRAQAPGSILKIPVKTVLFCVCLAAVTQCADRIPEDEIREITAFMETAWRSGDKKRVASVYSDDAYLIHPGGIAAHGRKEVDAYWEEFSADPVDWKLSTFLVTKDPGEIFELARFRKGKQEMKLWTGLDIKLPANPVFQYGQSDLTYISDGITRTSTVEFILVWKETAEGWRVFMDTYR